MDELSKKVGTKRLDHVSTGGTCGNASRKYSFPWWPSVFCRVSVLEIIFLLKIVFIMTF